MSRSSTIFGHPGSLYTRVLSGLIAFCRGEWGMRLHLQLIEHLLNKRCSRQALSVGIGRLQPIRMPSYRHLYGLKALLVPGQEVDVVQDEVRKNWVFFPPHAGSSLCFSKGWYWGHPSQLIFMGHSSVFSSCNDNRGLRKVTQISQSESKSVLIGIFTIIYMQTNCLYNRRGRFKNLSHVKQKVCTHHWWEKLSLCSEWAEMRAQCVGYFISGL